MTEPVWEEAHALLREDAAFGRLVEQVGPVRMDPVSRGAFASLVRAIVYQQLAGKAAATIHGRVVEAVGGTVSSGSILDAPDEILRGAGLSRSKLRAIRDLAAKVSSGDLALDSLDSLPDREVEERLVQVWGIGIWTAQMFLIFQLRRPDVWPTGDLGVRAGWSRVHGLPELPDARSLDALGDPYRPWRSAAAWYCWRAVEVLPAG